MISPSDIEAELSIKAVWDDLFEFLRRNCFAVIYFKDKNGEFVKLKLSTDEWWDVDRIKKGCEKGIFFIRRNKPYMGWEAIDQISNL